MHPDGLRELLVRVGRRYATPVVVSEFGMSEATESLRGPHLVAHARAIEEAAAAGVDVRAAFYWSICDNFEWTFNYEPRARFGLFTVDRSPGAGGSASPLTRRMTDAALALRGLASGGTSGAVGRRYGAVTSDGSISVPPRCSPTATYDLRVGGVRYLLLLARVGGAARDLDALVYSTVAGTWIPAAAQSWDPPARTLVLAPRIDAAADPRWRLTFPADLQSVTGHVDGGPQITGSRVWWDGTYANGDWLLRLRLLPAEQPPADPQPEARVRPGLVPAMDARDVRDDAGAHEPHGLVRRGAVQCRPGGGGRDRGADVTATLSPLPPPGPIPLPIGVPVPVLTRLPDEVFGCPAFDAVTAAPGSPVGLGVTDTTMVSMVADRDGWIHQVSSDRWHPMLSGRTSARGWVTAASRRAGQLDFVTIGTDGSAYTAARDPNGTWGGWWATATHAHRRRRPDHRGSSRQDAWPPPPTTPAAPCPPPGHPPPDGPRGPRSRTG